VNEVFGDKRSDFTNLRRRGESRLALFFGNQGRASARECAFEKTYFSAQIERTEFS